MEAIRDALKGQYYGTLAMFRQCIERCPEDVWLSGTFPRTYWRIAYHSLFYTHLYLMQAEKDFVAWDKHIDDATNLWGEDNPQDSAPYSREELLAYTDQVIAMVDGCVSGMDLVTQDSGFHWYPKTNKLEHQIVNIRHLAGHMGQLSELLMAHNIDVDWITRPK